MSGPDYLVLTCPACNGLLQAPRSSLGSTVGCPTCNGPVTVSDPMASFKPPAMITDPKVKLGAAPRGEDHAAPTEGAFNKDRLRSTSEAAYKVDPENPTMKRRDFRKQKHGAALTEWDLQPRHSRNPRQGARRLIRFMILASVVLLIVLAVLFWQRLQETAPESGYVRPELSLELKSVGDFRNDVWDVVQRFCAAPDIASILPLIRDPERVKPLLKDYYHEGNPWTPLKLNEKPDLTDLEVHRSFVAFRLPLADFPARPMALEETPDGFKIDWESFTGYSELSWTSLRRLRPTEPVMMRAVVRPSDYFNRDFPSSKTHRSFQISDMERDHVLYGYVPINSDTELQIRKSLLTATSVHAVIKVKYPPTSTNDRQVEITEILEKGWIFRDDDLPELPLDPASMELDSPGSSTDPADDPARPKVLPRLSP